MKTSQITEFCEANGLPEDVTREKCTQMVIQSALEDQDVLSQLKESIGDTLVPFPSV